MVGDALVLEELLERRGAFVVAFLEDRGEAVAFEVGVDAGVGRDEIVCRPRFEGLSENGVGVLDVGYHEVAVALA